MRSKSTCDISDEENFEKESRLKSDGKLNDGKTLYTSFPIFMILWESNYLMR